MVDEAHATGVLGPGGRGSVAAAGLEGEVDVIVGTLGKALGGYGAYVCCDTAMARYLANTRPHADLLDRPAAAGPWPRRSRRSTAARAAAPRRAPARQRAPRCAQALVEQGFDVDAGETADRAAGDRRSGLTMDLCERALRRGVFAQAIRPPTVPTGTSRLRLAAMATHSGRARWAARSSARRRRRGGRGAVPVDGTDRGRAVFDCMPRAASRSRPRAACS